MGFLDAMPVDVRIDLRRRYIRMPEHFLDDAQVRAVFEQMGREAVAQRVRCDRLGDAGGAGVFLDEHPNRLAAERPAPRREEDFAKAGGFRERTASLAE